MATRQASCTNVTTPLILNYVRKTSCSRDCKTTKFLGARIDLVVREMAVNQWPRGRRPAWRSGRPRTQVQQDLALGSGKPVHYAPVQRGFFHADMVWPRMVRPPT